MSVTRADILRIAALAELDVDEDSAAELEAQLNRILGYVEQLGELPHEGGGGEDGRAVRLRRDEPDADPLVRPIADWAPALRSGLFTVPRQGPADPAADA